MNRRGSSTAMSADNSSALRDSTPPRAGTMSLLHPRAGHSDEAITDGNGRDGPGRWAAEQSVEQFNDKNGDRSVLPLIRLVRYIRYQSGHTSSSDPPERPVRLPSEASPRV